VQLGRPCRLAFFPPMALSMRGGSDSFSLSSSLVEVESTSS
jgi:hypothetical protein